MRVGWTLTSTPLAKRHRRSYGVPGSGAPSRIPWDRFEPTRYNDAALDLASQTARSLATGEYGAVSLFGSLVSALARHGAPFDLVSAAAAIPGDEIRHAEYAMQLSHLLGGPGLGEASVDVDHETLDRRCARPETLEDLDAMMLDLPVMGETLATGLLDVCREISEDPVVRAFYANIVRDEVHHARLGWYYFAWRSPQWSRAERQRIADRAGAIVANVERRFYWGRDVPENLAREARALGILDSETQRMEVRRLMEQEIVPGLDALGLGASHAWKVRAPLEPLP